MTGYELTPDELTVRVATLTALGDATGELLSAAHRLAERTPMLGTAPPARHLALRLRDAAGPAGLTADIAAANTELTSFHQALAAAVGGYEDREADAVSTLKDAAT